MVDSGLVFVVTAPTVCFVLGIAAQRLRLQRTHPYHVVQPANEVSGAIYLESALAALVAKGFTVTGFGTEPKRNGHCLIVFALSPDRLILAMIYSYRLLPSMICWTRLYSRLSDGRYIMTMSSDLSGDEQDVSGLMLGVWYHAVTTDALLSHHCRRLKNLQNSPWPLDTACDAVNEILGQRVERMVSHGQARWTNSDKSHWRYSWRGSFAQGFAWVRGALSSKVSGKVKSWT